MDIRNFREQDRESVIKLWHVCDLTRPWNDPNKDIDRKLAFQADLFFVGTINSNRPRALNESQQQVRSTLIATAMAGYDGHRGSVFYLAIAPEHQNLGYGKQLMNHIENALLDLECPKLNIVVRNTNIKVKQFYDSLSYQEDPVISIGKRLIAD